LLFGAGLALQIAVDFVSPESMGTCLDLRQQLRSLDLALGEPTLQGEVGRPGAVAACASQRV
jgi:hypothetical protein